MEPSKEFKAAFRIIFMELMANGNNYMEAALLADGRMYKVRIQVKEIVE